jgi:hypothetical protein
MIGTEMSTDSIERCHQEHKLTRKWARVLLITKWLDHEELRKIQAKAPEDMFLEIEIVIIRELGVCYTK